MDKYLNIIVKIIYDGNSVYTMKSKFTRIKVVPPNTVTEIDKSGVNFSIDRGFVTLDADSGDKLDSYDRYKLRTIGCTNTFDVQIITNDSSGTVYTFKRAVMTYTQSISDEYFQFDIYNNFIVGYDDDDEDE